MMKKKIMSILLALVMVIGLLPIVAFAAEGDPEIYVGGVGMVSGDYLAEGASAADHAKTPAASDDNYAYYKDGVLTLKNYDYTGAGAEIWGGYCLIARVNPEDYFEELDLQIIYEGTNKLTGDVEDEESDCAGIYAAGGLTLTAKDESASLEITAEAGLRAQKDDVVISGGTVIVTSTDGSAIVAYTDLTITDSTVTANADGTYALKAGTDLTITDSTVTAVAKEYALHTKNVAFSGNSYVDAKITYNPGSFWAIRYDHVGSAGTFTYDGLNIQAAYKLDEALGTFQLGENQKYARVVIKPAVPAPVVNSIHIEGIVDLTSGQTVNDWYDAINDALADGSLTINDNTYDDETFFFGDVILIDGGLLDASKQSLAGDAVIGPGTYYFAICLGAADFADPLSVTAEGYGNDAVSFDELVVNNGYEQIIVYVKMVVVEPTPEVWVGGVGMFDGDYLAEGASAAVAKTPTASDDNYAYYKDGVLTLHNYDYSGAPEVGSSDYCAVYRDGDLKVVLDGENSLTLTAENLSNSAGIFADNLTVEKGSGSGKLTISGAGFGIFGNAVTINSGTFDIDVHYAAIIAMQNITIKNGDYDLTAESWGCIYSYDGIVTIENGNLVLVSENGNGIHSSTGSINVKNGTLEIEASTGIESVDILIEGGKLTIAAEYGVYVYSEDDQPTSITIKGGNVDVTAEYDGLYAYDGSIDIQGGEMVIRSTDTENDGSYAAFDADTITIADTLSVLASTVPEGSDPEVYDKTKNATYDYVEIAPKPIEYNVWVIGTRVTSDNKDDVLNDGKVSYDPDTNTLTVSRDLAATGDQNAVRAFTSGVLHIQLSGDRSISSENAGVLYTSNSVEITSDGDVTITCASDVIGPIPDLKVSTSGDVTLENTNGKICNSSLTITGVDGGAAGNVKVNADTTTLSGGKFVAQTITVNASGDVEITNAGGAVSTSALTVTGADDVTVTGDTAGFLITSSANIAASGDVTMENANGGICPSKLTIAGIDGGAAGNVKVSANTKNLDGGKFVAQTIEVKAAGDVKITNAGGAVSTSALTVTGADDVIVTGDTAGFLIIPSANIAASGDVTMENANGGICPSKLTIAGIDGGAAENVKVSANTKNLDGGKFVAQTIEVKAAGDVAITNEGGSVVVTSVDIIADGALLVGAPAGPDTADCFKYENFNGNGYSVSEGESESALSVAATKAAGETYSDNMDVNVIKITAKKPSGGGGGSAATYAITVENSDNGDISASKKSASKGTDITLTVKADEGYELDTLNVLDKNGDKVKVTKKDDKYTFEMPASKVTVKATFSKIEVEPSFEDVAEDAYYFDAVEWAVEEGVTSGTSATTFSPNAPCTRAQAVTFLWRAAGSPAPKSTEMPFVDVAAGAYYYDAVLWAVENGITAGTSATTFSPNNDCTRAQIVTFLWRSQKSPAGETVNPFTDVAAEAYYFDAVLWAVKNGVTAGTTANTFSPNNDCTRAQIVTFLFRALGDEE